MRISLKEYADRKGVNAHEFGTINIRINRFIAAPIPNDIEQRDPNRKAGEVRLSKMCKCMPFKVRTDELEQYPLHS